VKGNPVSLVDRKGLSGTLPPNFDRSVPIPRTPPSPSIRPAPIWNDFSNAPNYAPDLPGGYSGVNFPWEMPNLVSYCEICVPKGNPFYLDNGTSCPKDMSPKNEPKFEKPDGTSKSCTCVKWRVIEVY